MTSTQTLLGRSSLIAAGALASRITGFVRTAAIGAALGASLVGNAYTTATMLPGIINEILLGGIGTAILVPVLNRARTTHPDGGEAFAQRLLSVAVLAFAAAAILATAAMPVLIPALGGNATAGADANLTLQFAMFTVPAVCCYGTGAVATAILNSRGTFALPAWSPACNNLTLIAAATILISFPAEEFNTTRTVLLGAATLTGAAFQAGVLLPALRRSGIPWRWQPDLRGFGLRSLARTAAWVSVYVAAGQVAVVVIIGLTRAAAAHGGPGPLIYNNAWLLLMMAYGIIALPIITALTPELSTPARRADTYRTGVRLLTASTIPVAAAMTAAAQPVAIAVFQWGEYTHPAAIATGTVITCAGFALVPYALTQLQFFTFLAVGDAKTPACIMIAATAARIVLCALAYLLVPVQYAVAAMMAANAATYTLVAIVSAQVLRRRMHTQPVITSGAVLRSTTTAAVILGVGYGTWRALSALVEDEKTAAFVALGVFAVLVIAAWMFVPQAVGINRHQGPVGSKRPAVRS